MGIRRKRLTNISKYINNIKENTKIIIGIDNINRFMDVLELVGFTKSVGIGEMVLPANHFGPTSMFNAEGGVLIHKDKPKETYYITREWHWREWRGRYDSVEKSKLVDVPHKRYPRTPIPPPSVELRVASDTHGNKIIVSPIYLCNKEHLDSIKHVINLFLEIFGEFRIFNEEMDNIIKAKIKKLNWRILPPGRRPWGDLEKELIPLIRQAPKGNQTLIEFRLKKINDMNPDFVAIGEAGFRGYVIFGFEKVNVFVFESMYYGNATYIFDGNWESVSKLSKAEILNQGLQKDRIIHRVGWEVKIKEIF